MTDMTDTSKDARASDLKKTSLAASLRDLRLLLLVGVTLCVWLLFHFVLTDGFVLTARNLSTLSVQMTVTGILAIGMTLLLIAREIDLSAGAVMAIVIVSIFQFQVPLGLPAGATVLLALCVGGAFGLLHGLIRVWLLIPSFIITLAGFSWIRGLAFIIPDGQTLAGASDGFYRISNNELPVQLSALLIVGLGGLLLWSPLRRTIDTRPKPKLSRWADVGVSAVGVFFVAGALWAFTSHRGLPYPTVLLVIIALVVHGVASNTAFGRHVYAIGGNPGAAKRVGINVRRIIVSLFVIMGLLTGTAAVIQASLLDAGPPGIGELLALNAISAAIIGGTNLFGGHGSIPGTVAGALLMASISNGLSLAGVNTFYQMVATGLILLVAVGVDSFSRRREIGI
jgi:D-xylose transport system permease protein